MGRTSGKSWRRVTATVRRHVRDTGAPCALCHGTRGPIDWRTRAQADTEARARGEWWLVGAQRPLSLHVDHIIPFVAGGTDTLDNAQPTHAVCNESKGAGQFTRRTTKTKKRAVVGFWIARDGNGPKLAGRAVPGSTTTTHIFVAATDDPQGEHPLT